MVFTNFSEWSIIFSTYLKLKEMNGDSVWLRMTDYMHTIHADSLVSVKWSVWKNYMKIKTHLWHGLFLVLFYDKPLFVIDSFIASLLHVWDPVISVSFIYTSLVGLLQVQQFHNTVDSYHLHNSTTIVE